MQRATLVLGAREFEVQTAGFKRARPWKKRLFEEVKPLFERVGGASSVDITTPADLFKLLPLAEELFTDGIDLVCDMLITYSPVLEAEREYIEEYATDKQILAAFQEVAALADPFGLIPLLTRRIGRATIGTSSNSPSANGALATSMPSTA